MSNVQRCGVCSPLRRSIGATSVTALTIAMGFALVACAGNPRPYTPVAMSQTGDDQWSCTELNIQLAANSKAASDLLQQHGATETANNTKGVASLVLLGPIGLLIAMSADYSREEQVKARALIDRNERLTHLAKAKSCASQ